MTTRFNSRFLSRAFATLLLLCSARVRAEPSPADFETARGLYVEGLELRDAGKLEGSLARFKAAHALAATPITSLELARGHMLLGQLTVAREVLLSIERMPVLTTESPKAAAARMEARALAERTLERMASLRVTFTSEPGAAARVTIDGAPFPPDASSQKVNPGRHVVIAESAGGARASAEVVLAEGEARTVTLMLAHGASIAPPGDVLTRASHSPWFYAGLGTAGVGLATGTLTGVVALSKASSLESECIGNRCPRSAESDLSTSRTMGTVSTIAFAVAGAGIALAVVTWVVGPERAAAARRSSWSVGSVSW